MASSFWFLLQLALILPFMSSSSQLNSETSSTITASPALLANPPPSLSPYQELSPDISPLLPSPGGVLPSPAESSMLTIPSNPSPPNPDDFLATGPESACSPFGSMPAFTRSNMHTYHRQKYGRDEDEDRINFIVIWVIVCVIILLLGLVFYHYIYRWIVGYRIFLASALLPFREARCVICLDGFVVGNLVTTVRPCRHTFHSACIRAYRLHGNRCPNCRSDMA